MSNQQTTTYLYQFTVQDDATRKFREYLANLRQYEREMASITARMDKTATRAGGFHEGTRSFSQTARDGAIVTREYTREIKSLQDGLFRSQSQLNAFGNEVGKVNTVTFTGADGVRKMYRSINTDATPGKMQLRSFNEQVRDGSTYSKEWTVHFNDKLKSVARGKEVYNTAGRSLGRFATVSYRTKAGVDVTKVAINDLNRVMEKGSPLAGRFVRHMTWIAQGIVLWAGIGVVTDAIRGWYDAQIDLNTALTDFEIRTGATGWTLLLVPDFLLDRLRLLRPMHLIHKPLDMLLN